MNSAVEDSTSGACEPQDVRFDRSGGQGLLISIENSLDKDFGISSHSVDDDMISLQPGQNERQNLGLLSSEEGDRSSYIEQGNSEQVDTLRFGKYTSNTQTNSNKENEFVSHDKLGEIFGEDAQTQPSTLTKGLYLDRAQIDILNNSWRSQFPDSIQRIW